MKSIDKANKKLRKLKRSFLQAQSQQKKLLLY